MRVHSSRQARSGILVLVTLILLAAVLPSFARTPYEMDDATEGDPGDGVLSPLAPASQPAPLSDPTDPDPDADRGGRTPSSRPRYALPTLHVPGLGWLSLAPVWDLVEGRWHHAP